MAGVGKLLKQAQKMQKQMQAIQEELAEKEIEISVVGCGEHYDYCTERISRDQDRP